jgi:membrane protease YdiL (CAAX protease family)
MSTTSSPTSSRRSHKSRRGWALAVWLALAALLVLGAFASRSAAEEIPEDTLYDPSLAIGGTIFYGLMVGISLVFAYLVYPRPRRALGFNRPRARWFWSALGLVVLTVIVSVGLEPVLHAGEEQGFAPDEWEPERAATFVANAVVTSALGPFAEELFFRGLGVRVLGTLGAVAAIVVSAVVFGLVHGLLVALPTLVVFGLGLAWLRIRSGSLWPSVFAHALFNSLGILFLILSWTIETPS